MHGCKSNPEESFTTTGEYIPSVLVFPCLQYRHLKTENKYNVYRRKDCMKKFSESLRDHAMKIINFKKKK